MTNTIQGWAAPSQNAPVVPFAYDAGALGSDEVEVAIEATGVCHSDLSMIDNEWGNATYPLVGGHEIIGTIIARGALVTHLAIGQRVGIGWNARSCLHCTPCMAGDTHLCSKIQPTIVRRHGGFADKVRAHHWWTIPIPEKIGVPAAAPLLCGGITVFSPFMSLNISPTARVGILGIGGLGHLAVQFARAWGCDVTAFTRGDDKREEAMQLGAHRVVNIEKAAELNDVAGQIDVLISTVNQLPALWQEKPQHLTRLLAPKGKLHWVGALLKPLPVSVMQLIGREQSVSGSPTGSRAQMTTMLEFCARHQILPKVEIFPMTEINAALDHVRAGKARYRVVLVN